MLNEVDKELEGKQSQLQETVRSAEYLETQVNHKTQTLYRLREEAKNFENKLRDERQKHDVALGRRELKLNELHQSLQTESSS